MLKIFVTGDNHIGKKYDRYPEVKDIMIQSRFDCLEDMVRKAENEGCGIFAVTGDLFDNTNTTKSGDVKKVVDILAKFSGTVLVLPGNHDFYTGNDKIWKDFSNVLSKLEHNIILLNEFRKYCFDIGEEKVVIYPAFCQTKHSTINNLQWIKDAEIEVQNVINIGIAHGAIKGVTPDLKEEYFLMTETELEEVPVDAWLIGHTHITYPKAFDTSDSVTGYKVFNAGTHEQMDLHNNTEGNALIISIEKHNGLSNVTAEKYQSGKIRFYDISLEIHPHTEHELRDALESAVAGKNQNSVIRINVSGSIKLQEYEEKESIYKEILGKFLTYEKIDSELSEEITVDKIRSEFAETSFAARFMEQLVGNTTELQMAYQLLQKCKDN